MHRFKKLLWILFILWFVFFIICDEKWYKIWFEDNQIIFGKAENKSDFFTDNRLNPYLDSEIVYKNSNLIRINPQFEIPYFLRDSDGMDPVFLAKLEEWKKLEEERKLAEKRKLEEEKKIEMDKKLEEKRLAEERKKYYTWWNNESISSVFKLSEVEDNMWMSNSNIKGITWTKIEELLDDAQNLQNNEITLNVDNVAVVHYPVVKYDYHLHVINLLEWERKSVDDSVINIDKSFLDKDSSLYIYRGKKSEVLYKTSNIIRIYWWFKDPINMRSSAGMIKNVIFTWYLEEDINMEKNGRFDGTENDMNSSWENADWNEKFNTENIEEIYVTDSWLSEIKDSNESMVSNFENIADSDIRIEIWWWDDSFDTQEVDSEVSDSWNLWDEVNDVVVYKVRKYRYRIHSVKIYKWIMHGEQKMFLIDKPDLSHHLISIGYWKMSEKKIVITEKYRLKTHTLALMMWKAVKHDSVVEDLKKNEDRISEQMLENLLNNEDIDLNTLESKNDEFLQNVFEKTRDIDIMNFIIENYIDEYQFVKAKKFIENLPDTYRNSVNPLFDLRVAFNSFALTSKTIDTSLLSLVQEYYSSNKISEENKNLYMWVVSLIDQNYEDFFSVAANFTTENNVAFASKLQWYRDQISKQMWMPEYYFDTLVSLELFNQWFFQPAKVLALYSLQQNSNYILPYQILAYANFLTNSRETSIEYLKRLVDLDPNNTEKYNFLMWVAYYRNEKYEQSVVMLSMIKDEKLRLDAQRYLINDYLKLDQKNKLIFSRNKLLWYENLVASDFYSYFYETFFRPYSEWSQFQLYAFDTELADKMLRVCNMRISSEENVVCIYWSIWKNIALWKFDWLEQSLLNLVSEYPQWYLYQALWEYYLKQNDLEKAKFYLLKAVPLSQKWSERQHIKRLLQDAM